jgi:hypothetical protein
MRLGDSYQYRRINTSTGEAKTLLQTVTGITDSVVEFNKGKFTTDLLGNHLTDKDGTYSPSQVYCNDYAIGKEWKTRFGYTFPDGRTTDVIEMNCKVVAREAITIPAGTFDAFKVQASGWRLYHPSRRTRTFWIAPDKVPRFIALEVVNYNNRGVIPSVSTSYRQELMSFTPGQG